MRVVEQSSWVWTLLEDDEDDGADDDALLLDVQILAQGPMSGQFYSMTIVLDVDETQAYRKRGSAALDDIAERMNRSTSDYQERDRRDLSQDVTAACVRWRAR
ncbi:hypothetical protein [Ilumatobacter coccineus]|uniref:Uncharacterized protein n=1 Tax=Ilumatobacter coccineus (strain NBRC 103263 / KCTC 29153 / YM16-304) TaxID=1313172 RepID=A0A6C7ECQ1_ILUCY|nr:hypothetical protein [Ilumatobacter coccineus]BAN04547.1 hypothetical protein YM304_42330 [Ilumatobacter coccineus YM16-304]